MRFNNFLNEGKDLRKNHDEKANVDGGVLYIKDKVVQVWWTKDGSGKKINKSETWTAPDKEQAKENFEDMKDRFK